MTIRVQEGDIHLTNLKTRMPFKYGIATMTRMPMAVVGVALEMDGRRGFGVSSDLLTPKWFTKIPDSDVDAEVHEMLAVIARTLEVSIGIQGSPSQLQKVVENYLKDGYQRVKIKIKNRKGLLIFFSLLLFGTEITKSSG